MINTESINNIAKQSQDSISISHSERDALFNDDKVDMPDGLGVSSLILAYCLLFFILLVFIPKVYLANSIYYVSKNIHYLHSQKEALKNDNLLLQHKLEATKFNFLTLELDEIK